MPGKARKALESMTPSKDKLMKVFSVLGGLFVLVSMIPGVPWRKAAMTPYFGSRFAKTRGYTPLTVGDPYGKPVTWSSLRSKICKKETEFAMPNPAAQAVGMLSSLVGAGQSLSGCASWQACKTHTSSRCTAYTTMLGTGIFVVICQIISAVAAVATPILVGRESVEPTNAKERKERKKMGPKEYGHLTMVASIAAFGFNFVPFLLWTFISEATFRGLQDTGFYPFPAAAEGMIFCHLANFFLFVGMYCGVTRIYWTPAAPEEEEEQPEQYGDPNAFGGPPGAFGEQAGGFGGPPGGFGGPPGGFGGPPGGFGGPPGGFGGPPAFGAAPMPPS